MRRPEDRMVFGKYITDQKGMALFIALMLTMMLSIIGLGIIKSTNDEISIAGNELHEMVAFYAAEAGLEKASAAIQTYYEIHRVAPDKLPAGSEELPAATIAYTLKDNGPAELEVLTTGSLSGLNALVKTYTIESFGTSIIDGSQVRLTQEFEASLVPIFQFAVFYMGDLWTQPRFDMTINGRTHVNGNMHLRHTGGPGNRLLFNDKVTSSGDILHGFGYGNDNHAADILFSDLEGNQVSMKQNGEWYDANHTDWFDSASSFWSGRVQDRAFGQTSLNLPVADDDAHKIIERASGGNDDSYENRASLKIINGVAFEKMGESWVNISGSLPAGTIIDSDADPSLSFYDAHEEKSVANTQIDIDLLRTSGHFPDNGVIYISDHRSRPADEMNGVSLINGSEIGSPSGEGLTIACENPLYVEGNFNTVRKEPVSVLSDAVTFLSNNWDPLLSGNQYSDRNATTTTVNMAFITGDLEASGTNYGGGLENLPRFLEDWNGTDFNLTGSMVQGWHSRQAKGTWRYIDAANAYYSAPTRNWTFDTDFEDPSKLPPETPQIQLFQRTSWRQADIGYSGLENQPIDTLGL